MPEKEKEFLNYISNFIKNLKPLSIKEILSKTSPDKIALFSIDMIKGFCTEGPLSTPRINSISSSIKDLLIKLYQNDVKRFVILEDLHQKDSLEFKDFPPHCLVNNSQSETIDEIKNLSFFNLFTKIKKNALSAFFTDDLLKLLKKFDSEGVNTYICVGNCTDLCVYHFVMPLKLRANQLNKNVNIIVAKNCIATYDLPVKLAKKLNAFPHNGDLLDNIFIYHMALNGIIVVKSIT